MRNPGRKALYALAAISVGGLLVLVGSQRREAVGETWSAIVPEVVGATAVFLSALFLVRALLHMRGRALLLAGRDVLARWHVAPADWDRFRAFDKARMAVAPYRLVNELWIAKRTPSQGVDIIVGNRSLLVDGSYHVLRPRGLPELRGLRWLSPSDGAPACLEFAIAYPTRTGTNPLAVRIPVPTAARAEAQRVYDWFEPRLRRKPTLALRSPRRTYWTCLAVVIVCLGAAAGGWLQATANGFRLDEQDVLTVLPLVLMVGGIIFAAAATLVALMTFLLAVADGRTGTRRR